MLDATGEVLTVKGTVLVNEVEGRHFELQADAGRRYVLVPAARGVAERLEQFVGRSVRVWGALHCGPSIFMRGAVLLVTEVTAAD